MTSMRILALNAYHGGSHQAFLEGWSAHSRHEFDVLTLPAYKWKWRMRHAPVTFSDQSQHPNRAQKQWDVLFCTDMLNLAEFRGLCRAEASELPSIVYFHENQLTYPNRESRERDLHYAFTNVATCLAADAVWFNSAFHRDEFLDAVDNWMRRMPDHQLLDVAKKISTKSSIHSPGISVPTQRPVRNDGPLRILWVSRWEHDKDPETFFAALRLLQVKEVPFRLAVLGESYENVPECFAKARDCFSEHIDHWGYAASREQYVAALLDADVVVSTALHEFFGIAVIEAVAAGCFPLVPRSLAYPEVLGDRDEYFHDGTAQGISSGLSEMSDRVTERGTCWLQKQGASSIASQYSWPNAAERMDQAVEQLKGETPPNR